METRSNRIILLGGSAGGLNAITELVSRLEPDLPAAVLVVLHLGAGPAPAIADKLTKTGPLEASFAATGAPIEPGQIYIAPPDHHTLVQGGRMHLSHGPRVNNARPAIDLTFRSAAVAYGARAVGVVLSGMLDDGAMGLDAIGRCGGVTIVQDPADASYSEMPESALAAGEVDYTLPASSIGELLNTLAQISPLAEAVIPTDVRLENEFDMNGIDDLSRMDQLGNRVPVSCPDCGGPLWEIKQGGPSRYRCHVGHSLSTRTLLSRQNEEIEQALWIALRTLEEKARMQSRLAEQGQHAGRGTVVNTFHSRAEETRVHAERLRQLLTTVGAEESSAWMTEHGLS